MKDFWEVLQAWPVIIQGALGSALFALIVVVGQKMTGAVSPSISRISVQRQKSRLITQMTRLRAVTTKDDTLRGYYASILWLRSSRYLLKGLIWLALGLAFGSFISSLGVVGYIGCIFYLFSALDGVKAIKKTGNEEQQLTELGEKLKELNSKLDV